MSTLDLSFVFPCLNEEETMAVCLNELNTVLKKAPFTYEIIISDNGSTDRSVAIAKKMGARVVHAAKRGYGEALKNGFAHAKGTYVAFADIDGSYPLEFLPKMMKTIMDKKVDMVIASRMTGTIETGAMPWLHQHVGTPALTGLINLLFRGKLSDCNSGFRVMKKTAYESWGASSGGMEFASELLIKALKHKAKIIEIPAGLRPDKRTRAPHLKTWRDGMRHLLFILSESPKLFEIVGLGGLLSASFLQLCAWALGPTRMLGLSVFDYHSQILFLIVAALGLQSWIFAMFLYVLRPDEKPLRLSKFFIDLKEENLFFTFVGVLGIVLIGIISLIVEWASSNFSGLHKLFYLINFLYIAIVLGGGSFGLLGIHVLKRALKNKE